MLPALVAIYHGCSHGKVMRYPSFQGILVVLSILAIQNTYNVGYASENSGDLSLKSSNSSSSMHNLELQQELINLKATFQKEAQSKADDVCKWSSVRYAVNAFLDEDLWKRLHYPHRIPALIQTSCLDPGSLGNALSEYIETRICALANGLHYIDVSVKYEHPFFEGFPSIVASAQTKDPTEVSKSIEKVCSCPSICHEWGYGLMHKHMHIAKSIFREAIDKYWSQVSSERSQLVVNHANTHVINKHTDILPFIPDVSIHYRCGDNLVTHYGFLPFRVFRKYIPTSTQSIYVMAEYPKRNVKMNSDSRCDAIFDAMGRYLASLYSNAAIVIIRGGDVYDDLIRLTYSKILICSASTFCLWPAIANSHLAYFPLTKLIAKEETNFDYGPGFHWINDPADRQILGRVAVHMPHEQLIKQLIS
jgi:hypothetical protein